MANIETRYEVELKYIHENKEIEIKSEAIKYITIDNNYLSKNFPIMYISANINSSLYDTMLKNIDNDYITLTIGSYDANKSIKAVTNYIKDEFIYFFANTDSNYNNELEKQASDNKSENDNESYREAFIGLISIDLLNYSKKIYNDVKSGTCQSIIYDYISSMKNVIIEPFDYNKSFKDLIIPPIVGIRNLVDYINTNSSFYKTQYMLFFDFSKTCYLLSCNGNGIKRKSNDYSSVIIDVDSSNTTSESKSLGMEKDTKSKCYKLNINPSGDYSFTKDLYNDKKLNKIITIDSLGNVDKESIDTASNSKGNRIKLYRSLSTNNHRVDTLKYSNNITNFITSITKSCVDSSLLTPEKSYTLSHIKQNKAYNGKHILINKQEIFRKEDEKYFTSTVTLTLAKTVS